MKKKDLGYGKKSFFVFVSKKNQIKNEIKEKGRGGGGSTNRFTFELFELLENMQISTNGGLGRISTPRMRLSQRYQEIITVAACK